MEMDYLLFVTSTRIFHFSLYILFISKILPWSFPFGRIHYARWLIIHHYDAEMLLKTNRDIFNKFKSNFSFTVRRKKLNRDVKGKALKNWKLMIMAD